jgi:serine/threonine protein kinase
MAYLHDRGIVHPLLTSSCISIHYRACISMLSPAFCSNSVEPSQLVYLPPEVIRTLQPTHVSPSARHHNSLSTHPANQDSTDANIFSFGTIVYEMVTMSRPFSSTPGELIIWEVGNNRCQSLHHMNSGKLKDLIQRCWSADAALRPSFKELLGTLEQNMSPRACGMNTYFSFSDPGRLDKAGLR